MVGDKDSVSQAVCGIHVLNHYAVLLLTGGCTVKYLYHLEAKLWHRPFTTIANVVGCITTLAEK